MMEETKKSKSLRLLTVLLSVAAVAAMLWCAPYFKDDWAWGSQVGLDRLQTHFTGYNGRYLGNLLVMVLTRSLPVKIISCLMISSARLRIEFMDCTHNI